MALSKTAIIGIAVVAVIAIGAVAAFSMMGGGGGSSNDITYELNGGVNSEYNPTGYKSDVVTLYDPSREGYDFSGWYLEPNFINKVTSLNKSMGKVTVYAKWAYKVYNVEYVLNCKSAVNLNPESVTWGSGTLRGACSPDRCFDAWYSTPTFESDSKVKSFNDIKSDTTLYAKWKSVAGTEYVYNLEYTPSYSIANSSTVELKVFVDNDDGSLISSTLNLDIITGIGMVSSVQYQSEWSDSDDESNLVFIGMDTLSTIDGKKELFVFKNDELTMWTDEYYHPYVMDYLDYKATLASYSTFTVPTVATVTVYSSDGITVKGSGTYKVGDSVKLTATASSGKTFKGFSFDGNGIVNQPSMEFMACDSLTLFALEEDDYAVYAEGSYTNPTWTITDDRTGKVVKTVHSNPAIVSLEDSMSYTASFTAKSGSKDVKLKQDLITGGSFTNEYYWKYNGYNYSCYWTDFVPNYVYYKNYNTDGRHHINNAKDSEFVTYTDSTILDMRDFLEKQSRNMSDLQRANFVLRFVQETITYTKDASGKGMNEYWKYPYETLFDMRGDCEDTAILYAALMKSLGYEVALILYDDHMATGIGMPSSTYGTYYEKNGTCYYYCETTATGWWLGDIPDGYDTATVIVIS